MNTYTYNELFEYLHKDGKNNFIMSFDNPIEYMETITKFTIHSAYDIKKLDYMINLQDLIINCPLGEKKIKSIMENPNVAKITSLEYANGIYDFYINVSELTNLTHLKCYGNIYGYSKLKNLTSLELDECDVEDMSGLTLLKKLIVTPPYHDNCKILDISKMSDLEYLEITSTNKITLNISGCNKLNCLKFLGAGGEIICDNILPNLSELAVITKHTHFLNNEFPELRKLKIYQEEFDTSSVYKFPKLRKLDLKYSSSPHKNINNNILDISHFPELNILKISPECNYYGMSYDSNITIIGIENAQNIEELNICGVKKIDISNLTNLRKMKYSYCNEIIGLNKILNLHTLSCDVIPENINDYVKLRELKVYCHRHIGEMNKKKFTIDFNKITNTNLTSLCIKVDDNYEIEYKIIGIYKFDKLRDLHIECCDFDVEDIKYLKCLHKLSMCDLKTHHSNLDVSELHELTEIALGCVDINYITGISDSVISLTIRNTEIKELDVTNLNLETCELRNNSADMKDVYCILRGLENSNHLRQLDLWCVNMTIPPNTFSKKFPRLDNLGFECVPDEKTNIINSKMRRKLNRDGIFCSYICVAARC